MKIINKSEKNHIMKRLTEVHRLFKDSGPIWQGDDDLTVALLVKVS